MNLKQLWQFMQVDMEADRFEKEIRQSPKRLALIKQRNTLMDQQENMKRIEADIAAMGDRLEAICAESERLQKVLENLTAQIEANPAQSEEEVEKQMENVKKLLDDLTRYEQETAKMRKDAEAKDRQQRDIRLKAAKTKAEYDQNKAGYDQEFKRDTAKLKKMRENVEEEGKKVAAVEPELYERYQSIRQHAMPPMAKLIDGQCSGCFMGISQATQLSLREGKNLVTCDNCGRILFVEG